MKTYKFRYGGKKGQVVELKESPDMVVVRTKDNQPLEDTTLKPQSREMLQESTEVLAFPEAGVTVHRMPQQEDGLESTSMRDQMRSSLKDESDLRFAGRVLEDAASGKPVLYTENFFVKFLDGTPKDACLSLLAKYGLTIKDELMFAENAYFAAAAEGTGLAVFDIAERLLDEDIVEYCHPELVQERRAKGAHPLQWHLAEATINGKKIRAHVDVLSAWKTTRGKGITIAVIDDGIDIDHPEFAGRIVHPYDATLKSNDPRPKFDAENHGTACAGVACAAGLDDGASGTAPQAALMPIRLRSGLGSVAEANAFAWAANHGADVISCSWGPADGDWYWLEDPAHHEQVLLPDSTRMAIDYATTKGRNGKGCVVLFAAGNGNESVDNDGYAAYPGVIAVAACNDRGQRSVYSDYGKAVWVCFPSNDFGHRAFNHPNPQTSGIRTTDRLGQAGYARNNNYVNSFGGTSSACPGAAGVVALMLAANPALTSRQVKDLLRQSTVAIDKENGDYDPSGHSPLYGYGRLDAGKAVQVAKASVQPGPTPAPTTNLISGTVRFNGADPLPLAHDGLTGDHFKPAKRVLGFTLNLPASLGSLRLVCRANVPGIGISQTTGNGAYTGTTDARRRIIGFSVALDGPGADQYVVEYSARLKGVFETAKGRDGAWCGTEKKSGKTIEALEIRVRKG